MRKRNRSNRVAAVLVPLLAVTLHACGGDGGNGPEVIGGTVTGTVYYEGDAEGALIVAAFLEWPTLWAPELFVKIASPDYPQDYKLEGLDPGEYYIFAFIDVEPASPTMPGEEDIQSEPTEPTYVSDTEEGEVDITLPAD